MASKEEKKKRRAIAKAIRLNEHAKLIDEMPLSLPRLKQLFDCLDEQLGIKGCDHTSSITQDFLIHNNLKPEKVLVWLREQGGFCDCEILANVEQNWEDDLVDVSY